MCRTLKDNLIGVVEDVRFCQIAFYLAYLLLPLESDPRHNTPTHASHL